ncbi:MAG: recombinase family protein [FCB group bacterium]|jgi:DNA invertase Pin-like site-specific DNA recombinase
MKIYGFIKESLMRKDIDVQKVLIFDYVKKHSLKIEEFIEMTSITRKGSDIIDIILNKLNIGDIIIVTELTRLGKNLLQVLNLLELLTQEGIGIIFVKQPELSTDLKNRNSLPIIYKYIADAEREFISQRTKQGLAAAQAQGRLLGRPKGSRNKKGRLLDPFKNNIKYYLEINIPIQSILKLLNRKLSVPVSYNALKYFIENDRELKYLKKKETVEELI